MSHSSLGDPPDLLDRVKIWWIWRQGNIRHCITNILIFCTFFSPNKPDCLLVPRSIIKHHAILFAFLNRRLIYKLPEWLSDILIIELRWLCDNQFTCFGDQVAAIADIILSWFGHHFGLWIHRSPSTSNTGLCLKVYLILKNNLQRTVFICQNQFF